MALQSCSASSFGILNLIFFSIVTPREGIGECSPDTYIEASCSARLRADFSLFSGFICKVLIS